MPKINGPVFDLHFSGLETSRFQKFCEQPLEAISRINNQAEHFGLAIVQVVAPEHTRDPQDAVQRSADFVAHSRHELSSCRHSRFGGRYGGF